MLFSTNKPLLFTSCPLYETRACNASQRRDLTWESKGGITFYSLVSLKAIGGPFPCLSKMRESQIRVEDTLSIFNFSKLATETWLSVFWKRLFQAFFWRFSGI
jgi:hypothetical protein